MTIQELKEWIEEQLSCGKIKENSKVLVSCYEQIYIENEDNTIVDLPKV